MKQRTIEILEELDQLVFELCEDSRTDSKLQALQRHPDLKELLRRIYDDRFIFNVTGRTIDKYVNLDQWYNTPFDTSDLLGLLDLLHNREVTGDEAIFFCCDLIRDYAGYRELLIDVFNKDLKAGISKKTVNKAFPGLIPEFNVPLANLFSSKHFDVGRYQWFLSRKMDGVRCLAFIHHDKVECWSRNGVRFNTLQRVEEEIHRTWRGQRKLILDGELCINGDNDIEDFIKVTEEFRKKNYTMDTPKFMIFDVYSMEVFGKGIPSTMPYEEKYVMLKDYKSYGRLKYCDILPQTEINSNDQLQSIIEKRPESWEGLMLRRGDRTEFKRSNLLLKVKNFIEKDFNVFGVVKGTKIINGKDQECVSSLIILLGEDVVGVGSGLSDEQRLSWLDETKIVDKQITVKYFSETVDKTGKRSLRFPVLKSVRDYE